MKEKCSECGSVEIFCKGCGWGGWRSGYPNCPQCGSKKIYCEDCGAFANSGEDVKDENPSMFTMVEARETIEALLRVIRNEGRGL